MAAQTDTEVESAIRIHEQYKLQVKSARATVHEDTQPTTLSYTSRELTPPPKIERVQSQWFWAIKGKQLYTRIEYPGIKGQTLDKGGSKVQELFYDGKRTASIDHYAARPGMEVTDSRSETWGRTARHNPLEFGYITASGEWISDVLRQRKFTMGPEASHAKFGRLIQVVCEERDHEIIRLWLAPKHGMLAVRSQLENTTNHWTDSYEADTLESQGGLLIPVKGRREWKTDKGELVSSATYTATDFQLNNVPDSQFEFKPKGPGSYWDADTRSKFLVDTSGKMTKQAYQEQEPSGGFPIRWVLFTSMTTLIVCAMGALIRWRIRTAAA